MSLGSQPSEGRRGGDLSSLAPSDWLICRGLALMIEARIPGKPGNQPRVTEKNQLALGSLVISQSSLFSQKRLRLWRCEGGWAVYECGEKGWWEGPGLTKDLW